VHKRAACRVARARAINIWKVFQVPRQKSSHSRESRKASLDCRPGYCCGLPPQEPWRELVEQQGVVWLVGLVRMRPRNLFYTGDTRGKRLVVLQKPRRQALVEAVIRWYNYPEYQAIVPIRHANSNTRAACLIGA
jgi:hypothetical protein